MKNNINSKNILVVGCGRWATFLAWYCDRIGHNTAIWGRKGSQKLAQLKAEGCNEYVKINKNMLLFDDLEEALDGRDIVIISIASQQLRTFLKSYDLSKFKGKVLLCMKGLESATGKRLSEVAIEEGVAKENVAVWLGPGHIQEFVKGVPNCMTIDSHNKDLTRRLVTIFDSDLIRFYYGADIVGNEIGGAMKNVIGIAAGMLDGLGYSTLKGPLMARGVCEVSRLISAMGGNDKTAYGLAHLGDYETTLFSPHSNNRKFGEDFIKGNEFKKLSEGVETTNAVIELANKLGIEMPITQCVFNILFKNSSPAMELSVLFKRGKKEEF